MTDVRADETTADDTQDAPAAARRTRRGRWVAAVVVLGLLLVAAWQAAARTSRVEPGGVAQVSGGLALPDCVPSGNLWASFDDDEEVLAAQTIRNPSPWPVTVSTGDSEAYLLEPRSDDQDEQGSITSASGGVPDAARESVVVPGGQEATLWIHNPQRGVPPGSIWYTYDGVSLTVRALGIEREVWVPFSAGVLQVGGSQDSAVLSEALEGACAG